MPRGRQKEYVDKQSTAQYGCSVEAALLSESSTQTVFNHISSWIPQTSTLYVRSADS